MLYNLQLNVLINFLLHFQIKPCPFVLESDIYVSNVHFQKAFSVLDR